MPWPFAGPCLGVEAHFYSQLTKGKELKEGLEQPWESGQDGLENEVS